MHPVTPAFDPLDVTLRELAARGGGMFSAAMVKEAGIDHRDIARAMRQQRLERITRGWYALPEEGMSPEARHGRLAQAVQRRVAGSAVSHQSALILHGLPVVNADLRRAHLTDRGRAHHRGTTDCVVHEADASTARLRPGQIVIAPEHAAVAVGLRSPLAGLVAADQALRLGLATERALLDATVAARGRNGWRAWRAVSQLTDGASESPPETLARYGLRCIGLDVVPQHEVWVEGRMLRLDLAALEHRLAIEVDGAVKYAGEGSPSGREAAQVVMAEKAREAALVRAGWRVLRLTWREIVTPDLHIRFDNLRRLVDATLRER